MSRAILPLLLFLLLAIACAPITPAPTNTPALTDVTVVMGYVPNVQYAPFYVADQKGYFASEGLRVHYNWGFEFDGIKLVGANQADFAIVTGDQIIQARAQNIPIVYVGNWYNAFPIEVVSLADKNIRAPSDLVGKNVGLPALFGASYTAWRALLYASNLNEQDIRVQNIGFTQIQALENGSVDAAVVYANNEPVQLEMSGHSLNTIKTWEFAHLIGNGVAVNESAISSRPLIVRAFVRALLRGVQDSLSDPATALTLTVSQLPEAGGENLSRSEAILRASLPLWQNSRLGETRLSDWQSMADLMLRAKFISAPVDVSRAFTNDFIQ